MDNRQSPVSRPLVLGEVFFDCFKDGGRVLGSAPFNVAWHPHAFDLASLLVSRARTDAAANRIVDAMHRRQIGTRGIQRHSWWRRDSVVQPIARSRYRNIDEAEVARIAGDAGPARMQAATLPECHERECVIVARGDHGAVASECIVGRYRDLRLGTTLEGSREFAAMLVSRRGAIVDDRDVYGSTRQQRL